MPTILALIRELADYEHAIHDVKATEESLANTLTFAPFSSDAPNPGFARTLILTAPEGVAGMALYFYNYSTWRAAPGIYLEDLYVRPEFRKRGYGTMLIQALAKEVIAMKGGRLEWACLTWNEPSLRFYESIGAKQMKDWVGLRVDGEKLLQLAGSE